MNRMNYQTMETAHNPPCKFLVLGKTGNGKSSVANAILGQDVFVVGRGMSSTTTETQHASYPRAQREITVIDTPDVTDCGMNSQQMQREVSRWRGMISTGSAAILLTVRCDIRYTPEEYAIYRQIKTIWGNDSLSKRLVVVFTFGDRQDRDIDEELKTVCPELKSVLRDANGRYVVFDKNNKNSHEKLVLELLEIVQRMGTLDGRDEQHDAMLSSRTPRFLIILGTAIAAVAIGCIIFMALRITGAAIAFGVIGILLVLLLSGIIYTRQKNY